MKTTEGMDQLIVKCVDPSIPWDFLMSALKALWNDGRGTCGEDLYSLHPGETFHQEMSFITMTLEHIWAIDDLLVVQDPDSNPRGLGG